MYRIDQQVFNDNFLSGKNNQFSHKTNKLFNMFPFTASTQDKIVDSFDNILGAFLRMVYSLKAPKEINRDDIISKICEEVDCTSQDKVALKTIVKDLYFLDEHTLRCTGFNMFMYTTSSKNDQKISEYLVRAICDSQEIKQALKESQTKNNLLDTLVEDFLPKLEPMDNKVNYITLIPEIKVNFTKDLVFLIKDKNADYNDIIALISYYYFFYTSQVIMYLNKFCNEKPGITPVFFCAEWEKTSMSRECFNRGWRVIDSKLNTMFSHAVLLEMINQTKESKRYSYHELLEEYNHSSDEEKGMIFSQVEKIKRQYTTEYIEQDVFTFRENNYEKGNIDSLIRGFFEDILLQFESPKRKAANDAYKRSFSSFCKNNFLKRFGRCGNMLVVSEELLVLMTKVSIGDKKQVRLNELFDEFRKRGIYLDNQSQESIVEFYEKLNLIEKKSDSGDAQYVKGIL